MCSRKRKGNLSLRRSEQFIIGSNQMSNVHLSREAEAYFTKVLLRPTPNAYVCKPHAKKIALFTLPVEKNTFGQSFLEWHFQPHTFLARYNGHCSVRRLDP
jgi:hypothetical protein